MTPETRQPIPTIRHQLWAKEGRSELWQALVRRVHGADAVDNHGLSIADSERLVDAMLDEIKQQGCGVWAPVSEDDDEPWDVDTTPDLTCKTCRYSTADARRDMAAPVIYFRTDDQCLPCAQAAEKDRP